VQGIREHNLSTSFPFKTGFPEYITTWPHRHDSKKRRFVQLCTKRLMHPSSMQLNLESDISRTVSYGLLGNHCFAKFALNASRCLSEPAKRLLYTVIISLCGCPLTLLSPHREGDAWGEGNPTRDWAELSYLLLVPGPNPL
jgi:hypothetical protein